MKFDLCALADYLVHVEDEVKFTDIFEAFVQGFNKDLDQVQDSQLGFAGVDTEHKVERGIMTIN